jgi:hypothetical protein
MGVDETANAEARRLACWSPITGDLYASARMIVGSTPDMHRLRGTSARAGRAVGQLDASRQLTVEAACRNHRFPRLQ